MDERRPCELIIEVFATLNGCALHHVTVVKYGTSISPYKILDLFGLHECLSSKDLSTPQTFLDCSPDALLPRDTPDALPPLSWWRHMAAKRADLC